MSAVMWVPVAKSDADAKKRREVTLGLANNATGAAFGTIATGQAAALARSNYKRLKRDPNAPPPPEKPNFALRAYRSAAKRSPRVARLGARMKPHLTGRNAAKGALVLGGLNVAGQLANAGLDAQSTAYFARERKNLARKHQEVSEPVGKFDNGIGVFYDRSEDISKNAWVDPEVRRQRELATVSTGSGIAGLAGVAYGTRNFLNTPSNAGRNAVLHTMKVPAWKLDPKNPTKAGKPRKVRIADATKEIPVIGPDGRPYTVRNHAPTVGGNIRQGIRNLRRPPVDIPKGTPPRRAAMMRLRHAVSMRGRVGAPIGLGLAGLGVSGAAYRLGHGKNERPWQ